MGQTRDCVVHEGEEASGVAPVRVKRSLVVLLLRPRLVDGLRVLPDSPASNQGESSFFESPDAPFDLIQCLGEFRTGIDDPVASTV